MTSEELRIKALKESRWLDICLEDCYIEVLTEHGWNCIEIDDEELLRALINSHNSSLISKTKNKQNK